MPLTANSHMVLYDGFMRQKYPYVDINHKSYPGYHEYFDYESNVLCWLDANINRKSYEILGHRIFFNTIDDATMFKLVWL